MGVKVLGSLPTPEITGGYANIACYGSIDSQKGDLVQPLAQMQEG